MNSSVSYLRFRSVVGLSLAVVLVAGCASQSPAPVRQGTTPPSMSSLPTTGQAAQVHVVRPGDTLIGIGRLYGRNVGDLVVWNNLMDPNQLRVGQTVRIAPPTAAGGVEPIAIAQPVEIQPIAPAGVTEAPVKHEPRGGRQPYSDQAWAAINPGVGMAPPSVDVATPPPPATQDTPWLWPAGGPVLAGFDESTNKGVDIGGNPGDPIIASAAGQVVYSGSGLRGYGKLVIIKHNDEFLTAYAHNQTLLVKEGDDISKGQRIAELGSTDADRPKLHFEIRRQGRPVDPMQYLPPR